MLSRGYNLRSLERFLYKHSNRPIAAACDVSDIIGTTINIKPATMNDLQSNSVSEKDLWRFAKLIEKLGLRVIFERRNIEGKFCIYYYVSRSHKKARELQGAFHELWNNGKSKEIDTKIGRLLGYPNTAIRYFANNTDTLSKAHLERARRNRFYAHSATYEDEEFLIYEKPIYLQLVRYCPKSAKILREQSEKRWLD